MGTIGMAEAFRTMGVDIREPGQIDMHGKIAIQPTMEIDGIRAHAAVGIFLEGIEPSKHHRLLVGRWIFVPEEICTDTADDLMGHGLTGLAMSALGQGVYATREAPQ